VSLDSKRSNEFRRYRQALTVIYLGTAAFGFALLTASVFKELFFRRPAVELPQSALTVDDPDPEVLLDCHRRVLELLNQLGTETCELLSSVVPSGDRSEVSARWREFSRAWRDEWDVVNAQCRFSELAETRMGVAYDRLAQVHDDLRPMWLKYQSLLVRFDDEQAAELARMRRALDLSRNAFEKKAEGRSADRPSTPAPATRVEPTPPTAP
jgi:hypothetical protein